MKSSVSGIMNGLGWLIMLTLAALVLSCQRDGLFPITNAVRQQLEASARDNTHIFSATHDILDLTAGALAGQGIADGSVSPYGRATGSALACAPNIRNTVNVDKSHPDSLVITGTLTLDFGAGAGCSDSTEMRKGKIVDHFIYIKVLSSRAFHLTETLTFDNFQKDSVTLDGTFIRTTSSDLVSTLEIQNAVLTYNDATFTTFAGQLTSTIILEGELLNKHCVARELTGSVTGTTRTSLEFSATIGNSLVFKYGCSPKIPVSGTIDLVVGDVESLIDFGDGTCDKVYAITSDGVTTRYSLVRGKWSMIND